MENLRGVKIVNQDSLMVENSHLYIKAKDENYCELTILDENGKKRKVGATHTNSENEIKITVGTSFASVGQYQRQFNQAVEDWKGSIQTQIDNKANSNDVYKKNETYSKIEINGFLSEKQNTIGYTTENVANKQNTLSPDGTGKKYTTVDAVNSGLSNKLDRGTYTGTAQDLRNEIDSKQSLLSSFDESILIENDGNIEGNVSLFEEYFEQQECELNFTPIQIVAVYQDGIRLSKSEYEIILPKKIKIKEYVDENIQVQYTKLKI